MLTEFSGVKQLEGQRPRRWFHSEDEDLIIWYADDGSICGFQLCYDRQRFERALTWLPERGFSHNRVDDGDSVGMAHKRAPILVPDGVLDIDALSHRFLRISGNLPKDVFGFVSEKLREYAEQHHGA